MVGLPGEDSTSVSKTVNFINRHHIQGLKIHSTYVIDGTELNMLYKDGKYTPISYEEYMKNLVYILTHVSPEIVIHRISGDAPKDMLIAPEWNLHKKLVMNNLDKILKEQDLYQGIYYTKKSEDF